MAARAAASSGGLLAAAALAFLALQPGCLQDEERKELLPSGIAVGHPVDTTVPGELPEGTFDAFGLKLPRRMKIVAQMDDAVYAVGTMRLEHVTNYVRSRVDTDEIETGPTATIFSDAKVRGGDKTLQVQVSLVSRGIQIIVRDKTRKPAIEGLSEKERWKRVGLTPDGKVLKDHRLE